MKTAKLIVPILLVVLLLMMNLVMAADEKKDLATGEGVIPLMSGDPDPKGDPESDHFRFEPRYGYAYTGETGTTKQMWLLMTDQDPAGIDWSTAKDRVEALRLWCESKKAPFVLVELDTGGVPQLLTQCPGNGGLAVEMISTINGLASVKIDYEINDGKRLRGHLQGGNGTCGEMTYCEQTKDYYFDVTFSNPN